MKLNITKIKVLAQPAPRTNLDSPNIEDFCYLGSFLSSTAGYGKDIERRIQSGHASFGHLKSRVFCNKDQSFKAKLMVYRAVVVPTLLYGCETWTVYREDMKKLERFHQSKLRSILNIKWEDRITNNSVLERSGFLSVEALISDHCLRWSGHVSSMNGHRILKICRYGELSEGKRSHGAPLRQYKDQLKSIQKSTNIDPAHWEDISAKRSLWRHTTKTGSANFEKARVARPELKRPRESNAFSFPNQPLLSLVHNVPTNNFRGEAQSIIWTPVRSRRNLNPERKQRLVERIILKNT
eukprot:XP_014775746.1 PREDICTED: uncharacterized protein LOC106873048 [Octopus bimaculoides]